MVTREAIYKLPKPKLLDALECIDQHFWPHAPTRQTVATLREAIWKAVKADRYRPDRLAGLVEG